MVTVSEPPVSVHRDPAWRTHRSRHVAANPAEPPRCLSGLPAQFPYATDNTLAGPADNLASSSGDYRRSPLLSPWIDSQYGPVLLSRPFDLLADPLTITGVHPRRHNDYVAAVNPSKYGLLKRMCRRRMVDWVNGRYFSGSSPRPSATHSAVNICAGSFSSSSCMTANLPLLNSWNEVINRRQTKHRLTPPSASTIKHDGLNTAGFAVSEKDTCPSEH